MLRALTPEFDLPILITQHLPSLVHSGVRATGRNRQRSCRPTSPMTEPKSARAKIAIATGHGHMDIRRTGDRLVARISSEPARSGCLPSVDPMLRSASDACNGRVLAVILSGMGRDGIEGVEHLVEAGGTVWTQNADTSAVWGMPGAVTKAGFSSYVAAPNELGAALMAQCVAGGCAAYQGDDAIPEKAST